MGLGQDVRTYLLSKSAITSLVGTRIHPNQLPQKTTTFPVITYAVVSSQPAHHLRGGAGYAGTRMQFDVYSDTALSRDAVVEALRNQLQGFPTTSSSSMGSSTVTSVKYLNSIDQYEPPTDNSDTGLYRNITDYWFRHSQAAPTFPS